ncbi:MAG: hypothetical protein QW614_03620 [Candidatus Caldarchaeum sp.]|uniref:Uncharacterized protein n=1 Tax=Caldiarchaeum subterraneum TaxID=311458 RepID=A0A7C5LC96_CALS0
MGDLITEEIISLIESHDVVGLATHRHYPRERIIYSRFGRCGFAIDVVKMEKGSRRTYSVLVEAEAEAAGDHVEDFLRFPGKIRYFLSVDERGGKTIKVKNDTYKDASDLFSRVERVRQVFYRVYHSLKQKHREEITKVGEEIFHAVGLTADELHLGV